MKGGSPLADALVRLKPGAEVRSTRPEGRGFPLVLARGKDLVLFASMLWLTAGERTNLPWPNP